MRKPCNKPGCPNLVDTRTKYCAAHAGEDRKRHREYEKRRKQDPALAEAARIRSTRQWKAVRRIKLGTHPLCEDPLRVHPGRTVPARQVHHIKPLATHPELAFHADNLMSVCHRCHRLVETRGMPPGGKV